MRNVKLLIQIAFIASLFMTSCKTTPVLPSRTTLGMTKEQVIAKCGKPDKASSKYDKEKNLQEILLYKENTWDYGRWSWSKTVTNHLFVFKNNELVAVEQLHSINPDWSSIGYIVLDENNYVGTGFVLNNKRQVVTCAHVIDTSHVIYYTSGSFTPIVLVKHQLKLVKLLTEYDLALLESKEDLCTRPFINADDFNFAPNQHLFYIGYSEQSSSGSIKYVQADHAYVSSVGKTFEKDNVIDFIEFIGVGLPGYSGGPVINDKGEVIAIMREAWLKQGIKGGPVQLINRAISIIPITKIK